MNDERNTSTDPSLDEMSEHFNARAHSIDPTPRPGFKEALFMRLKEARQAQRMSRPSFAVFSSVLGRRFALASVPALAVIVIAVLVLQPFFGVKPVYAFDQFTLTPEQSDASGVDPNSAFILESQTEVNLVRIQQDLVIETDKDNTPTIEAASDRSLRIAFEKPLSADELVHVGLATSATWPDGQTVPRVYNWAFQVKGTFRVTGAIPGHQTQGVPLDSAFEFQFSQENVDEDAFERALTITPTVKGHVEHSRRSFVFVPEDPLLPKTVYHVVLSKDLPVVGGDGTLGEDYEITFETAEKDDDGINFGVQHYLTTSPGQDFYTESWKWVDDPAKDGPVHAKVYRLPDLNTYLSLLREAREGMDWRGFATAEDLMNGATYPVAFEVDPTFTQIQWQNFLVFPEPFEEGYYLIDYSLSDVHDWSLVASSNVTAYVSRAVDQTLVWANDAATNAPLEGATITYDGDTSSAQTNADGLGSVPAKEDQSDLLVVKKGEEGIVLSLEGRHWVYNKRGGQRLVWDSQSRPYSGQGSTSDHWTYLYTDRPLYQPTDSVNVWGYVEARADGTRPEKVRVWVGGSASDEIPTDTLDEMDVPVTDNGTFLAELSLKRAAPSSYQVGVATRVGDVWMPVAMHQITVSEYVKPAYTLSVTTNKDAMYIGEEVGFTVHGAFFEGTPVKGLPVHVTMGCYDQVLTLDSQGNASDTYRVSENIGECPNMYNDRYPRMLGISVVPNRPEEGNITASEDVRLFGPKVYIDPQHEETHIKDGTATVTVLVRNTQAIDSWDAEEFAPTTRAGQTVTGTITEITYEKNEVGTYYDFIRKRTVKQYSYDRKEKSLGDFSMVTNADGKAVYTFPSTVEGATYDVSLNTTDELGRTDSTTTWISRRDGSREEEENLNLAWHNEDAPEDEWRFEGYDVGDEVHLSVYQNGSTYVPAEGERFLYYKAQQGIRETFVGSGARIAFPFLDTDVPNVSVYGVLYSHGAYMQVGNGWGNSGNPYSVELNEELRRLTVKVTPEETAYAPGSEAKVMVEVMDANGKPVQAEVNLNVVDEAFYTLMPEEVDPLLELYQHLDSGVITTKVSAELKTFAGGAEGGGGGGDRGRFEFKDTAAFTTVQTGRNGTAEATIKLPDNITQWRVTAQAIDVEGKQAGDVKAPINASLPFFLVPVLRETYLDDDQPTMLVRAAGTVVAPKDMVEYEIRIPDVDFKERRLVTVEDTLRLVLPDLPLGKHEVTIEGKTGTLKDTITRTVSIVESRLVKPVVASALLSGNSQTVSGATDGMTTLTFVDGGRGRYYSELQSLYGSWGERVDEQVARYVSAHLLNTYFDADVSVPEIAVATYQEGGIKLLAYAAPEYDLAAKMALFGTDSPFYAKDLISYFSRQLDQNSKALTPMETAEGIAALAALDEPVLTELQRFASQPPDDSGVRLWLALGLHAAGDDESARVLYRALAAETETVNGYTYLAGPDQETTSEWTALLAVLAGALGEPQRDALSDYVADKFAGNTLLTIDRALFLNETLPVIPTQNATVQYTLEGQRYTQAIDTTEPTFSLVVDTEELVSLDLSVVEGVALAVSRYLTPVVDPNAPVESRLGVVRTYENDGGVTTSFAEGDLVKIQVDYTLPDVACGWMKPSGEMLSPEEAISDDQGGVIGADQYVPCETYEITDSIPSGLSLVTSVYSPYQWEEQKCVSYPVQVLEGRATFFVTQDSDYSCEGSSRLVYYARVVTPGVYEAEPVYIRSTRDPETNNHSSSETITIHE